MVISVHSRLILARYKRCTNAKWILSRSYGHQNFKNVNPFEVENANKAVRAGQYLRSMQRRIVPSTVEPPAYNFNYEPDVLPSCKITFPVSSNFCALSLQDDIFKSTIAVTLKTCRPCSSTPSEQNGIKKGPVDCARSCCSAVPVPSSKSDRYKPPIRLPSE